MAGLSYHSARVTVTLPLCGGVVLWLLLTSTDKEREPMPSILIQNEGVAVFEGADGSIYAAPLSHLTTYHQKNALIHQVREQLLAISPEALKLAKAYYTLANLITPDTAALQVKIRNGLVTEDADAE